MIIWERSQIREGSIPAKGSSLTHRFSAIGSGYRASERQVHSHVR